MTTSTYRILIIGAGGFGREVLSWLNSYPACLELTASEWYFGGFLDQNPRALDDFNVDSEIIGKPLEFDYQPTDRVICSIADPATKLMICRQLDAMGIQFVNLIHDKTIYERGNKLGKGVVMVPGATMTTNVTIGNFVTLNVYSSIGHDVIIGDGCTINGHSDITGGVVLNEGVFIGTHASVIPSVTVGEYARIGAGSSVVRKVPPYTTVMGVPAKKLFTRKPDDA